MSRYKKCSWLFFFMINFRRHSALGNGRFTPVQVHHDSHAACLVARINAAKEEIRQRDSYELERQQPSQERLTVGDFVLVKSKKDAFLKTSSVFNPAFSGQKYQIVSVDRQFFPWMYRLSGFNKKKKFYRFELQKVFTSSAETESSKSRHSSTINVKDVIFEQPSRLRSGRLVPGKGIAVYLVERDGKVDRVPASTLRILKRALEPGALTYDSVFNSADKSDYVI